MKERKISYDKKKEVSNMDYVNCKLCPSQCGADRNRGIFGRCDCPDIALVSKTMIHRWEEPALAGEGGSGAIFFGGCTMGCVYCQNRKISGKPNGALTTAKKLREMMDDLIARGAENIDLVSPTPYLPTIVQALEEKLPVPVVYNSGGWERVETLRELEGKIDIYLPDLKYSSNALGKALSGVNGYFETACAEMFSDVASCSCVRFLALRNSLILFPRFIIISPLLIRKRLP